MYKLCSIYRVNFVYLNFEWKRKIVCNSDDLKEYG